MVVTLDDLTARHPNAETFRFGDSAELSALLLGLVRAGKKRATCSHEGQEGAFPVLGRCDIALEWDGRPALLIKTVELRNVRFCDMTEDMALLEGENDSLAGWRADHQRYFERHGIFDPQMMLMWERFEVLEDFADV